MNETTITIGMDLGDKKHVVCILDASGEIARECTVPCTRKAVAKFFGQYSGANLVIESGTHSRWVSEEAKAAGLETLVGNARKLRAIWANAYKTDVRDAELLARMGRFDSKLLSPIEHRSAGAQQDLAVVRARDMVVRTRARLIQHVRGMVKSFGERIPSSIRSDAFARKAELPEALVPALEPTMELIAMMTEQIRAYDQLIGRLCLDYAETETLQQVVGVGPVTSLAFVLTLEEADRFEKSRMVGPYLGLTPRLDESGKTIKQLGISKAGNAYLRKLLVGSAQYILGPFGPECDLRRYGMAIQKRGGKRAKKRAVVAVARKLAVLLHALWKSGEEYEPNRREMAAA